MGDYVTEYCGISNQLYQVIQLDINFNFETRPEFLELLHQRQYEGYGVLKEHLHTRAPGSASLFDVSHMGQIRWHGKDAVKFIEKMVVGDIASLQEGQAKLSLIMNETGGIVDDTVISNAGSYIYMVVNGGCKVRI